MQKAAIAFLVLILVLVGSYGWLWFTTERRLGQSLQLLLSQRLGLGYVVNDRIVLDYGPDVSAMWLVTLDAPADPEELLPHPVLADSDRFDAEHFLREISNAFSTDLSGYRLLVANNALGPGTICPRFDCNIFIAVQPKGRQLFVHIFKI